MAPQASIGDPVRTETLYAVIHAIAEGPDLDRVLRAVVDLLVDATSCHACFVYLREGDVLRIRAASPVFEHVVGKVAFGMDEGLTGWVARNRAPAFIREAAMDDPRMKYVPELHEDQFQSMVAVPLVDRHGDVIGVVVLHTEAPREFGQDVLDLLVHVASLVVGAVDNARLYERTQQQVTALSGLSALSQELASLTGRDELYTAGCDGIGQLLNADRCELSLFDAHGAAIPVTTYPPDAGDDETPLLHGPSGGRLTARLLDGGRAFGLLRIARGPAFTADDAQLCETAANHLALALRTAELIERLTAENRVRQVFDAFERGDPSAAAAHARAAGWDTSRACAAVVATPIAAAAGRWEEALGAETERRLRMIAASVLVDVERSRLRAFMPLVTSSDADALRRLTDQLGAIASELGVSFGVSQARPALADDVLIISEAEDAALVASALDRGGGAREYSELGPYRYLVALIGSRPPDRAHAQALDTLADYDARRGTMLVETLEAYLEARGAVRRSADILHIHPNTLRQRLERIQELAGLALPGEDLLSLELSLKVYRLHEAEKRPSSAP